MCDIISGQTKSFAVVYDNLIDDSTHALCETDVVKMAFIECVIMQ
jgi:hypothetical protein